MTDVLTSKQASDSAGSALVEVGGLQTAVLSCLGKLNVALASMIFVRGKASEDECTPVTAAEDLACAQIEGPHTWINVW